MEKGDTLTQHVSLANGISADEAGAKEAANVEANKTLEKMVPLENKEKAEQLKNDGNAQFKDGHFAKALELYTEAINLDPYNSGKLKLCTSRMMRMKSCDVHCNLVYSVLR